MSVLFETKRLRGERFEEKHLSDRYVGWLRDPEVVRYSEQRFREHTLESCQDYLRSFEGTPNVFVALIGKEGNDHVGNMNAYVEERHRVADIGVLLGRDTWGKGYGAEAWLAMMDYLFRSLPTLRKITGGCVANNEAMVRIMRRCGMQDDGRRSKQYVYDGAEVDIVYAAAFRDTWKAPATGR
jgi:RimJ/RimL family protein N-acetyltransferase